MMTDVGRTAAHASIVEQLRSESATVGSAIEWKYPYLMANNMSVNDPALAPLYADDFGRFWKERHHEGKHELVCVLDLRPREPAVGFGWPLTKGIR